MAAYTLWAQLKGAFALAGHSAVLARFHTGAMTVTKAAARRARIELLGSLAVTHGYAILGVPIVQPLLSGQFRFTAAQAVGLAIQGVAIYIAPYGEPS